MATKKRKPLGSAIEEFVFGTKEKEAAPPTPPTPTASLTPEVAWPASISFPDNANTVRFIAYGNTTAAGNIGTRTSSHKGQTPPTPRLNGKNKL